MKKFIQLSSGIIIKCEESNLEYINSNFKISLGSIHIPGNVRNDSCRIDPIFTVVKNFEYHYNNVVAEWEA